VRFTAWKLWHTAVDHRHPVLLRTPYDPIDDQRVKSWATLCEDYEEVSDWSILDDPHLFDFESSSPEGDSKSDWLRVFHTLPELSSTGDGYSRLKD
jgi:hypothetical protein